MSSQPFLVVHVKIQPDAISELRAEPESVVIIPFSRVPLWIEKELRM